MWNNSHKDWNTPSAYGHHIPSFPVSDVTWTDNSYLEMALFIHKEKSLSWWMEIVQFPMTRTFSSWGRATWEVSLASHHCLGKVGSEQREVDIWFQCSKAPEWDRLTCQGQATYLVGVEPYPGVCGLALHSQDSPVPPTGWHVLLHRFDQI